MGRKPVLHTQHTGKRCGLRKHESAAMNLSGGWLWHWRAWRSQARWAATSAQISNWLLAQDMPRQQLVLLGPSAGWMLPDAWLAQFQEIHTWDIDPLAAPLFRWRHGAALQRSGTALHLHTGDGLAQLEALTAAMPKAFFWFDNLLGQLRFNEPAINAVAHTLHSLQGQMHAVAWGSLHDRMSGPTQGGAGLPLAQPSQAGLAMESPQAQAWLQRMGAISPWLDHLTEPVLPQGTPVQFCAWPFKPGYAHWLEMGWCPAKPA